MKTDRQALVISAYPCCGKTYMTNNPPDDLIILDSDSSQFSWMERYPNEEEIEAFRKEQEQTPTRLGTEYFVKKYSEKTIKVRNPEFPDNYIRHIKENLDNADIIFVSSHLAVREALTKEKIPFITVYPDNSMLNEWVGRMYLRGDNKIFIDFQIENWDKFTNNISEEPHGQAIFRLSSNNDNRYESFSCLYIKELYDMILNIYFKISNKYWKKILSCDMHNKEN